jgi:hypothetical protein
MRRSMTLLLTLWVAIATATSMVIDVALAQWQAPYALRDMWGWRDFLINWSGNVPFIIAPTMLALMVWVRVVQARPVLQESRGYHAMSLVAAGVLSMLITLAIVLLMMSMVADSSGVLYENARLSFAATWETDGWLQWSVTVALIIAIPRLVLAPRLRRMGLVAFPSLEKRQIA